MKTDLKRQFAHGVIVAVVTRGDVNDFGRRSALSYCDVWLEVNDGSPRRITAMRLIQAFERPIRSLALSPDGQSLAAATEYELALFSFHTGERKAGRLSIQNGGQLAFSAQGEGVVYANLQLGMLWIAPKITHSIGVDVKQLSQRHFAGGVAISPDGKTLVASCTGRQRQSKLARWSAPGWQPITGFDFWSPFQRLAFSPNGEFLAGINREMFELRITVTGGLNGRQLPRDPTRTAFLTFPAHGETVAFGWSGELYIMETRAGNVLKRFAPRNEPFVDAAYTGNGRHLATLDGTAVMRVWSMDSWNVFCEYDWGAGGLTCIAVAADGLTGVCGTNSGSLIAFDVDE
jgi:WD40 repeat protein